MFFALMPISTSVFSQQVGCDFDAGFRAFDFWAGEWDVIDNVTGNHSGTNTIQKMENGCMLMESWVSSRGSTGTSVNYYNPLTKQWRQLWISEGRYSIDIVGNIEDGAMVLEGSIYYFQGSIAKFRGRWSQNDDGSVRQMFEQHDSETDSWNVWADLNYVRTEN